MKTKYFAFFVPSSPVPYVAIRARSKEDIQHLINACSHYTDKPRKGEVWYIGELTKFEVENYLHLYEVL